MLFWKLISASLRSQMQYPASFLMLSTSLFIGSFVDILGIWVLFDRFEMVKGWTLPEIGLIYGTINMGFALAELFSRGFDKFTETLKYGDFDRLLLRPISPLFQIAVHELYAIRIGRFIQGLTVLVWSLCSLSFPITSIHVFTLLFSIFGTTCLFYGLFIIQATIAFWTIETLELMNIATYGGVQTGQYPMSIYNKTFRLIFTLLIPIACVAYYPIATLLHHESIPLWLGTILPAAGALFLYIACQFWHYGVRHYRSTGN